MRQLMSTMHAARSRLGASAIVNHFQFKKMERQWLGEEELCWVHQINFMSSKLIKKWKNEKILTIIGKKGGIQPDTFAVQLFWIFANLLCQKISDIFHRGINPKNCTFIFCFYKFRKNFESVGIGKKECLWWLYCKYYSMFINKNKNISSHVSWTCDTPQSHDSGTTKWKMSLDFTPLFGRLTTNPFCCIMTTSLHFHFQLN